MLPRPAHAVEAQNGPAVALRGEEVPHCGIGTHDPHTHRRETGVPRRETGVPRRETPAHDRERLHRRRDTALQGPYPLCLQHGNVEQERKTLGASGESL